MKRRVFNHLFEIAGLEKSGEFQNKLGGVFPFTIYGMAAVDIHMDLLVLSEEEEKHFHIHALNVQMNPVEQQFFLLNLLVF